MGTFVRDLRSGLRSLARGPSFAVTAIVTIAIGIGANASIFTVANGVLLTPLPYAEPHRLITITAENPSLGWTDSDVDPAAAWAWRARARTLTDLTVFNEYSYNWTGDDAPERINGLRVTPNFLSVLGREPVLGRDFLPDELGDGRDDVVLVTDGFWRRRFGRDPALLGATLILDGDPVTVVGILPPDLVFYDARPDVLRPWDFDLATAPMGNHYTNAVARLADGFEIDDARAELLGIARALEDEYVESRGWSVSVHPLHEYAVGEVTTRMLVVLMGAVGFILLMACVNVANLLLARGDGRAHEIAVRVALGASRGRIVRQLLTESLALAVAGGALGLLLANWGYRAMRAGLPADISPAFDDVTIDGGVLAFTTIVTISSALLFGVLPALRVSAFARMRVAGRSGPTRKESRFAGTLIVLQTSMAMVLLSGGGLLMKSVAGMRNQDFGFDASNVLIARVTLPETRYADKASSDAFWHDVTERLTSLPGVVVAGTTQSHPLEGDNWGFTLQIAGQDLPRAVRSTYASPGLFEALGLRMVRGRMFAETDTDNATTVAIVNQAFVERYLGADADPLATTLLSGGVWSAAVVGVVHNVVERNVDVRPEPAVYLPISSIDIRTRSLVLRTIGDPADQVRPLESTVRSVDADLPIYGIETMETLVDRRVGGYAFIGRLMMVFALISLALGAVGIYGVTAHATNRRTGEIGLRLALGAERPQVLRMVVAHGARRAGLGLLIGLLFASAAGSGLSAILIDVGPRDPAVFGGVTLTLALVCTLGLYLPARRAAKIDPVRALAADQAF